ncbi:MAG: TetR/AcrR family transcriptional regulator [Firmicutes bacterium]|nr:TetR/AcrR family transcriptional regulator [Bacillota bacterium]
MLKPLTKEQTEEILRKASEEFANHGFAKASISTIAKNAGVSVGVIYKYYSDKKDLFRACVVRSLNALDEVFEEAQTGDRSLMEMIEELIIQIQKYSREEPGYFRLYHLITVSGTPIEIDNAAEMIEGRSAELYSRLFKKAKEKGEVRQDMDPKLFAYFFDNMLMMLHFSYSCEYYKDRFRVYCGDDITRNDEFVREQMLKFIGGALGGIHTGI